MFAKLAQVLFFALVVSILHIFTMAHVPVFAQMVVILTLLILPVISALLLVLHAVIQRFA